MADPVAAFIDGAVRGFAMRKGWKQEEEDRLERRRLAEQDQIFRKENRAFAIEDRAERRREREEDRAWAREDREFRRQEAIADRALRNRELAARHAFAARDQAWQDEERARTREQWQRDDALRNDITAATTAATDAYQADQAGPPPAARALSPFISRKVEGEANPFVAPVLDKLDRGAKPNRAADRRDYFDEIAAPRIEAAYLTAGQVEKAEAFRRFREETGVKRAMKAYGRAVTAAQNGDEAGFLDHLAEVYNTPGYDEDGISVVRDKTGFKRDKAGNVLGATITFRNDETGKMWEQEISNEIDLYRLGLGVMAPESVFERGIASVEAADKARAGASTDVAAAEEAYRKRLAAKIDMLASSDMQFVNLSSAEQVSRAQAILDEEDRAIAGRRGPQVPPGAPAPAAPPAAAPMIWRGP